jgi:hypothetical protein
MRGFAAAENARPDPAAVAVLSDLRPQDAAADVEISRAYQRLDGRPEAPQIPFLLASPLRIRYPVRMPRIETALAALRLGGS